MKTYNIKFLAEKGDSYKVGLSCAVYDTEFR